MPKTVLRTVVVMKRIPQPFGRKVWGYRSSDEKNQKVTYVIFEGLEKAKQEVVNLTSEAVGILQELPYENPFLTELLRWMVLREK